jgi:hypothetical protein
MHVNEWTNHPSSEQTLEAPQRLRPGGNCLLYSFLEQGGRELDHWIG